MVKEALESIHIRQERPEDYRAVEELTRETFWDKFWGLKQQICDEHLLVHKLRKTPSYVPELDLVAEMAGTDKMNGKLVGHIIYTVSKIIDDSGEAHEMLTFGPLSVHPDYYNKGIGKALMCHSFKIAKDMGYRAIIIFGHPDYYPRVGFKRAAEYGITTSDGKTFDPFMVYPLYDGALDGISGRYYLDSVYETLTEEDALKFDEQFPPKTRHTPAPIDVLLERLEPPAREVIKGLQCDTLALMATKSEREITALEGIDANAISTISSVMREHGRRWGTGKK